ncbi:MAG: hypothetical protein FWD16_01355 [Clostridia bacterium]|nr:hypothetical protein [Clostridia bacterium]
MKNALDFNLSSTYLEPNGFIQRFTSAYMFIESNKYPDIYDENIGGQCFGCGSGGETSSCKKNKTSARRCGLFFVFNTMTGNSVIRRRFDGSSTEMQKLIGDTDDEGHGWGTDFVVDFLFGYTGYEYREITDAALFESEIKASIDAGKPVIARVKQGSTQTFATTHQKSPPFHLITGYYGDALTIQDHVYYEVWNDPSTLKTEQPPAYEDLEALYIFGEKTARRYTLLDGMKNIRRVLEYTINEGLWDEYLQKLGLGEDGLDKVGPEELKSRAKNLAAANIYMYNFCSFGGAFGVEKLPGHYLHQELFDPNLQEYWDDINKNWIICDTGHSTGTLNWHKIWEMEDSEKLAKICTDLCAALAKAKAADQRLLKIVNEVIEILELSPEQKVEFFRNKEAARQENEARLKALLQAMDNKTPRAETKINLETMKRNADFFDLNYENGLMIIKSPPENRQVSCMLTPQRFAAPLNIKLRAKTDRDNIRVIFGYGLLILNWECNQSELRIHDPEDSAQSGYKGCGAVPVDEFMDIEWIFGREFMAVRVNGELRHIGDNYCYIEKFKDPDFTMDSPVAPCTVFGSTLTVESLTVTEF